MEQIPAFAGPLALCGNRLNICAALRHFLGPQRARSTFALPILPTGIPAAGSRSGLGLFLSTTGSGPGTREPDRNLPSFPLCTHQHIQLGLLSITAPDSSRAASLVLFAPFLFVLCAVAKLIFKECQEIMETSLLSHCVWREGPTPECSVSSPGLATTSLLSVLRAPCCLSQGLQSHPPLRSFLLVSSQSSRRPPVLFLTSGVSPWYTPVLGPTLSGQFMLSDPQLRYHLLMGRYPFPTAFIGLSVFSPLGSPLSESGHWLFCLSLYACSLGQRWAHSGCFINPKENHRSQ